MTDIDLLPEPVERLVRLLLDREELTINRDGLAAYRRIPMCEKAATTLRALSARVEAAEENVGILQATREALEAQVADLQRELAKALGLGPNARADAALARAYEMGRDDAVKPNGLTYKPTDVLIAERHMVRQDIRALTPPADLAKGVAYE